MKKGKLILLLLSLIIITGACIRQIVTNEIPTTAKELEQETIEPTTGNKFTVTNENISTLYNKSKEVNITKELDSVRFRINNIEVSKLEISEGYRDGFGDKGIVTILNLEVELENTSDDTISIYPVQGKVIINTKEENIGNTFFSDDLDGEFLGETKRRGKLYFYSIQKPRILII